MPQPLYSLSTLLVILALLAGMLLSIKSKKLTAVAAITGGLLGFTIYIGTGLVGLFLLGTFFILGTLATAWKRREKQSIYTDDVPGGARTTGQVLANGGVAGIMALLAIGCPQQASLLTIMLAASLASATADTLSSELGVIYGRRFYNCLSFKKDVRGLDGVISLEGTLIGILGACMVSLIYSFGYGWNKAFAIITVAGAAGNFADSVLGAALERRKYLSNNWVNFLSTLFAALLAGALNLLT